MTRFLSWYFLFLLLPVLYLFFMKNNKKNIKFSSLKLIKSSGVKKTKKHLIGKFLILAGIILAVIALSRPQSGNKKINTKKEGIDIVVSLDVSGSMKSVDFKPNRLEVAKKVVDDFVSRRVSDRISFVIFSGTAYTKLPLTIDYNIIKNYIASVTTEDVNKDGTAIGMGISVAVNRLKKSTAESKIIILATDGKNNAGIISPETASNLAKDLGIKIYTIGVGSDKLIFPQVNPFTGKTQNRQYEGGLDEDLLKEIATKTGGEYFRAKDEKALENVFAKIDELEKTKVDIKNLFEYKELYSIFLLLGIILIILGLVFEEFLFIKIP